MREGLFKTYYGTIHYWVATTENEDATTLVFLPGLTADHRLFEKQISEFENKYNILVWDAPGHGDSRPFDLSFSLMDKARWVHKILQAENLGNPVIIGQSMGGYVGQTFAELYPQELKGFIAIDSAPLQRKYVSYIELWLLKRMTPIYRLYPWKWLLKSGTNGVALSEYGRKLMYDMMMVYDGQKKYYALLSGHGMKMLSMAMEADLPYKLNCPVLLICGENDRAGSCIRYNKAWHRNTGYRLEWIKNAGHNSNTDKPEIVNALIEEFVNSVDLQT